MRLIELQWLNPAWMMEQVFTLYGGKGGSAPKSPDYTKLAQQQADLQSQLIDQTTQANRVNQYTPYGSIEWSHGGTPRTFDQAGYDAAMKQYQASLSSPNYHSASTGGWNTLPGLTYNGAGGFGGSAGATLAAPNRDSFYSGGGDTGQWSSTTKLTPELQAVLDQNIAAKGQSYDQLQQALGRINSNSLPQGPINPGQTAQDAIMARLNPQFNTQEEATRTRLYNAGVRPGSEAWDNEMKNFNQSRNDAYSQAALQGIGLDFQNRNQALTEQSIPLNLINAYESGSQAQMPQFQNYSQQAQGVAPDLMGAGQASYNGQMQGYNANQAANAGFTNGLFSLGAMALMSDRRLKRNIKRIGEYKNGVPKYSFEYLWGDTAIGAMADEVEKVIPEAVGRMGKFKTVNYAMLGE